MHRICGNLRIASTYLSLGLELFLLLGGGLLGLGLLSGGLLGGLLFGWKEQVIHKELVYARCGASEYKTTKITIIESNISGLI